MRGMRRGYETWNTDLGTAGDISEQEAAMLLAAFEGGGIDDELGKSFFRRIGSALKKVVKKVAPVAAFVPGGQVLAVAGRAIAERDAAKEAKRMAAAQEIVDQSRMVNGGGVGPDYLYQAMNNPMVALGFPSQVAGDLSKMAATRFADPRRVSFLDSLLSPLKQTARLIPNLLSQGLQYRAQVKALELQRSAMSKLLGFQQKVAGVAPPSQVQATEIQDTSRSVSQAEVQRLKQQAAQLRTTESQTAQATRLAEEREKRRKAVDRQANIAAGMSKLAANSTSGIPRLPRPKIPEAGAQPPRAPATAAAFPIGAVALVAVVVLLWLAFRR
jgi:hypothetical protein